MKDYFVDFDLGNINAKLENVVGTLKDVNGVLAVYVFGSYVSRKMHGLSDIDVCVIGKVSFKNKINILSGEFSEIFDISFFEDLPIWIQARVFREGECLFVYDEKLLDVVKLVTLNNYLDFKPVIDDIVKGELTLDVR